jgi:hypothetical protein
MPSASIVKGMICVMKPIAISQQAMAEIAASSVAFLDFMSLIDVAVEES